MIGVFVSCDIFNTKTKRTDIGSLCTDMQDIEDTFTGEEGNDKSIPESVSRSQSELKIIEAIYGTDKNNKDVTEKLRRHVIDNTLTALVSNLFFGCAPDKGKTKMLRVKYNFAGKSQEKTVIETQTIYLP